MTAETQTARAPRTLRRVLFQLHLWTGLIFCLPFVTLGITGTILTYDEELAELAGVTPHATAQGMVQSPLRIIDTASQGREGFRATSLAMPQNKGEAAMVRMNRVQPGEQGARPGRGIQVFVDPVSLEVLGTRDGFALPIIRIAHDLHGNMMLGNPLGRQFVGWLGLGMVLLGFSGLYMWWPRPGRIREAFIVRRKAKGIRFFRELHGAVGIWGLVVFMIVSVSGIAIVFPRTLSAMVLAQAPQQGPGGAGGQARAEDTQAPRIDIEDAIARAKNAVPGSNFLSVSLPNLSQPFRVSLAGVNAVPGTPTITVTVDSTNGEILSVRDPRQGGTGDRTMAWQRPLHAGKGLGAIWQFLVGLSGLLPVLFVVTGLSMWMMKRRRHMPQYQEPDAALEGSPAE